MKKFFIVNVIIFCLGFIVGFLVNKKITKPLNSKIQQIITYSEGKEIIKKISIPVPDIIHDTIKEKIPTDTSALFKVWKDYYLTRKYILDYSDDSIGTFKVNVNVCENKINNAEADIKPIIKTIKQINTVYKVSFIQPYVFCGTSLDLKTNQLGIGIDLKQKYLLGISGVRINNEYGYMFNVGLKF